MEHWSASLDFNFKKVFRLKFVLMKVKSTKQDFKFLQKRKWIFLL